MDTAASVIVELRDATEPIFHISHSRPVQCNIIMKPIADRLKVSLVPYAEWFNLISKDFRLASAPKGDNPARKLLYFFSRGLKEVNPLMETMNLLCKADTAKARRASSILRDENLPQLCSEDAETWLNSWREIGFI